MANKKVFTNLTFIGGAELISPRLNPTATAPTTLAAGQVYYDSGETTGYLRVAQDDSNFKNILHQSVGQSGNYFTLDGYFQFDLADGTTPFKVTSTTLVSNLNADRVDGCHVLSHANFTEAGAVTNIPLYGTNGVLKVGPPVAAEDATPRSYVDNAIQGLDHKESVIATTSGDITLSGFTAQGNLDAAGDGTVTNGQRILVKNQDPASENGIYIARSGAWELASDSTYGSNIVAGEGTFSGDGLSGTTPSGYTAVQGTAVISSNTLEITNGSGGSGYVHTQVQTTIGDTYLVSVDWLSNSAGNTCNLRIGTVAGGNSEGSTNFTSSGTKTITFRATAETHFISFGSVESTNALVNYFDNVKCRKTDLTDGAFVFVEEGTYANSSWVLSGDGVTWTQFSGAGQVAVTSNGAVAAPLTKSGDTIDFKYSTDSLSTTADELLLNGTAWTAATGGTPPTSWTLGGGASALATFTVDGSELKIARASGGTNPYIYQTFPAIIGRKYRVTYRAKKGTADARVGIGNTAANVQYNATNYTSTDWTSFDETYTATTTLFSVYVQTLTSTGTENSYFDSVKVVPALDVDALHVQSGGIDTVHLADDAVEPAKLLETGAYTMGGLTVNGSVMLDYNSPVLNIGKANITTGNSQLHFNSKNGSAANAFIIQYIKDSSNDRLSFFGGGTTPKMSFLNSGSVGIGADATSPSGTLHVSTARYGSELLAAGSGAFTTWSGTHPNESPAGWTVSGTQNSNNYIRESSGPADQCRIVTTDGSWIGIVQTDILVVGRRYKATFDIKAITGYMKVEDGTTAHATFNTSGDGKTVTFVATNTHFYFARYSGTLDVTIDNASVVEDNLADGVHADGDDLVVSGKAATGISIISQATSGSNLFFGDGVQKDFARITGNRLLNGGATAGDGKLFFQVSDGGAAASTVMTLFGADKSVKIEGGLGVGTNEATAGALTTTGAITAGGVLTTHSNVTFSYNSFYFEAGTGSVFLKGAGGSTVLGMKETELVVPDALTVAGTSAFSDALTGTSATFSGALTTGGILDHGGFPTVNSSTVQGLQDGACYDFDGTDDYIDLGDTLESLFENSFSVSVWVKARDGQPSAKQTIVGAQEGSADILELDIQTNGKFFFYYASNNNAASAETDSVVFADGQNDWVHVVCTANSGTAGVGGLLVYIDGVLATSGDGDTSSVVFGDYDNPQNIYIGGQNTSGAAGINDFNGQIRDVKIFPSALTAGDVRKLYSGENPKKNLQVELATNGTFTDATVSGSTVGGWTNETGWALSALGQADFSGSNGQQIYRNITGLTTGAYYKLSGRVSAYTQGGVKFRSSTANKETATLSGIGEASVIFQLTSGTSLYIAAIAVTGSTAILSVDDISLQEVGTLVDFNPRSASSETWYNAAIPALYNGTLEGGVTLSAGSTDHKVNGDLGVAGNLEVTTDSDPTILIRPTTVDSANSGKISYRENEGGTTGVDLRYDGNANKFIIDTKPEVLNALTIARTDGAITTAGNLGVGTTPGVPLHIKGAVTALGDSRYNVRIEDSTAIGAGVGGGIVFSGAYTGTTQTNFAAIWGEKEVATDGSHAGRLHMGARDGGTSGISSDLVIDSSGAVSLAKTLTVNRTTTGGRAIKINPLAGNESRVEFQEGGTTQWSAGNYGTEHSFIIGTGGNLLTPKLTIEKQGSIRGEADSDTKLLIHSDTTNDSTTFVDSSPSGHAITAGGVTKHVTDQEVFGATSMYFYGAADKLEVASTSDFAFSGDFTIDLWVRRRYNTSYPYIFDFRTGGTEPFIALYLHSGDGYKLQYHYNGAVKIAGGTALAADTWYHVAIARSGSITTMYLDGASQGTWSDSTSFAAAPVRFGVESEGSNLYGFDGYMDEIRISKGIARWTSSFTPPTRPYATVNGEYFADQDKISTLGFGTPLLRVGALDGACYDFDGTDDKITLDTIGAIVFNASITLAAWIKADTSADMGLVAIGNVYLSVVIKGGNLEARSYNGSEILTDTNAHAITPGVWHHVVGVFSGGNVTLYKDGVGATAVACANQAVTSGQATPQIGKGYAGAEVWMDGQIRDVKIIPSALNSGEVAQLYNGYNPKKNKQIELVRGGDFTNAASITDTNPYTSQANWTVGTGTVTSVAGGVSGNCLKVTSTNTSTANLTANHKLAVVSGKTYRFRAWYKSGNHSSAMISLENGFAYNSGGFTATTTWQLKEFVFTATASGDLRIYLHIRSAPENAYLHYDSVSVQEVTTLVDFNSQSASPTTWHNSAAPAVFDGTVIGASLSAGSTDRFVDGTFEVDGTLTGAGAAFTGNVGVGGDPDGTYPLNVVGGGAKVAGDISFTAGNSLQWNNNAGTRINASHGSEFMAFDVAGTSNVLYLKPAGVGIGTTSPTTLTELYQASTTNPTELQITNFSAGDAFINFIERDADGNTNGTKFGEANTWGFQAGYDGGENRFYIRSGNQGTVKNALSIDRDTPDINQQGNRIVNSQTVSDLHRTPEPSLHFDGYGDVVTVPHDALYNSPVWSVSVWLKPEYDNASTWGLFGKATAAGTRDHICVVIDGATNKVKFDNAGYADTSDAVVPLDVWTHLTVVKGDDIKFYINGVLADTFATGNEPATTNAHDLLIGNTSGMVYAGDYRGEMREFRYFNRALLEDVTLSGVVFKEVSELYNGKATPRFFADATGADILSLNNSITGTFDNAEGTNGWVGSGSGSISDVASPAPHSGLRSMECVGCDSAANAAYFQWYSSATRAHHGRAFRLTFWGKMASGTDTIKTEVYGQGGTKETHAFTTTWKKFTYDDVFYYNNPGTTPTTLLQFYFYGGASAPNFHLDDVTLEFTGEIGAFTPQSIAGGDGYRWNDTTSNENHGAVTGATMVGSHNLGSLSSANDGKLTITESEDVPFLTVRDDDAERWSFTHHKTGDDKLIIKSEVSTGGDVLTLDENQALQVHGKLGVGGVPGDGQITAFTANSSADNNATGAAFVASSTGTQAKIVMKVGSKYGVIRTDNGGAIAITPHSSDIYFHSSTIGTFKSTGLLGIGTASPSDQLEIAKSNATATTRLSCWSTTDAHSGTILFTKSSASTIGTYAETADGERLGSLIAYGSDTSSPNTISQSSAAIFFEQDGAATGSRVPSRITFHTAPRYNDMAEAMRINSNGRILNSQTVNDLHRTAEPSLRFNGTSTDYVVLASSQTLSFSACSVAFWAKREDASRNDYVLGNTGISSQKKINFEGAELYIEGTTNGNWGKATVTADTNWHHYAITVSSGTVAIYQDGVAKTVSYPSGSAVTVEDIVLDEIGRAGTNVYFKGEIKDVRIHNRALEDAEVAAAYNGESTPWKYADAGSVLIDEDFNTDLGVWESANGGSNSWDIQNDTEVANKMYLAASQANQTCNPSAAVLSNGKAYRITYDCSGASNNPKWGSVVSGTPVDTQLTAITGSSTIVNGTGVIFEFVSKGNPQLHIFATAHDSIATLDNIKLEEIGEVAAYTPQSIGRRYEVTGTAIKDKWFDETSNANHGTITGATSVGSTRVTHYGDLDMVDGGKLRINKQNDLIPVPDRYTEYQYSKIDTTPNTDGYSIRLAGVKSLECTSTGAVTATSGSSGNLKQVARVESNQLTWPNAQTFTVAARIDHNLGVDAPIVQVYQDYTQAGPHSLVEVEVRQGDWIGADYGALGSEQGADAAVKAANRIRYCTILFSSNPGNGTKWNWRVTG